MELKRSKSIQLEKESILALESILNQMNCEYRRLEPDNAGIDGEIDLVNVNKFEGRILKCQVKAGKSYISSENDEYLKIKLEKKYLDLWSKMKIPVLLIYYHPETKELFWKSINDYLKIAPTLLRKQSQSITIQFDKDRDIFNENVLELLKLVEERKFYYQKFILLDDDREILTSNWFPVVSFPDQIYKAPTHHRRKREITNLLIKYHSFILKDKYLYTFSNLRNTDCELRNFCDFKNITDIPRTKMREPYLSELLYSVLIINCLSKDLIPKDDRFCFSPNVLKSIEESSFTFIPLRRQTESSRAKIYIQKKGQEYKHHSVKLSFQKLGNKWYLEIEPDWYFSYPFNPDKTKKEIGIRITKEKAKMFNQEYLYLLHAMKSYLSDNQPEINLFCDEYDNSPEIHVEAAPIKFESDFRLFNDYFGDKVS